jgi:predicted amidohydrolase
MKELTVSLAQMAVARANPEENLKKGEVFVAEAVRRGSDVICFPEVWTTGFDWTANERIAAGQEKVIDHIAEMARRYRIWINGSMLALDEDDSVSNTSILFDANGKRAGIYRKTHLFSMLHEDKHMAAGKSLCTVDTPWGLAGLSVCYDIRFPELFRTYALKGVKIQFARWRFPILGYSTGKSFFALGQSRIRCLCSEPTKWGLRISGLTESRRISAIQPSSTPGGRR